MLICDTHADTLWRLAQQPASNPQALDITHDRLTGRGQTARQTSPQM